MPETRLKNLWSPRHWPAWCGVAILFLLGRLPLPVLWLLGSMLGAIVGRIMLKRVAVARRNLELCLSEKSPRNREKILRANLRWTGVAAVTAGVTWGCSRRRLRRLITFKQTEQFVDTLKAGQGVIMLCPHFVGLDFGGAGITGLLSPSSYMYQRLHSPVFDWVMMRSRTRFGSIPIEKNEDLRTLVRVLRAGNAFYYLPDQDAGADGVFVPFMGVPASSVPVLGRLARLGNAVVIPVFVRYLPFGKGANVTFAPAVTTLTGNDPVKDAEIMNALIGEEVRQHPEQYFWTHKRFKTRPAGQPSVYR